MFVRNKYTVPKNIYILTVKTLAKTFKTQRGDMTILIRTVENNIYITSKALLTSLGKWK